MASLIRFCCFRLNLFQNHQTTVTRMNDDGDWDAPHILHYKSRVAEPYDEWRTEPVTCVEDPRDLDNEFFSPEHVEQINASAWVLVTKKITNFIDSPSEPEWRVPDIFFECTNVRELILDRNRLQTIPTEIGLLYNITRLDLSYNSLTFLPDQVGELRLLSRLELGNNSLTHIPHSILQNCVELTYLSIKDNQLIGDHIIDTKEVNITCNWTKLQVLDLSVNDLTSFPTEICSCKSLQVLNISYNRIDKPIPEISQLTKLETVFLNGNLLNETMIPTICPNKLYNLQLGENKFTYVPTTVWHLSNLMTLGLDKTPLKMLAPPPLEKQIVPTNLLVNLQTLDLFGTPIMDLPSSILHMTSLTHIDLRSCYKLRRFPMALVAQNPSPLKSLVSLDLSQSAVDSIPPQISVLQSLRSIACDKCKNLRFIAQQDLVKLPLLENLSLLDCPQLRDPPPEVINHGFAALMGYMNGSLELEDIKRMRERRPHAQEPSPPTSPIKSPVDEEAALASQPVANTSTLAFLPMMVSAWAMSLTEEQPPVKEEPKESITDKLFSFWK